jgi:purine-binding chemotaxis protein CheW
MSDVLQFCTFRLNDLYFGIRVVEIQEIIRHQPMTRVPLAPPMVRGLINLRGQIVTAIDLRSRMDLPPLTGDQLPTNVVIRTAEGPISLLVDEIGDVVEVSDEALESPPGHLTGFAREVTRGVYKLERRLLLELDTTRVLQQEPSDPNPAQGEHAQAA